MRRPLLALALALAVPARPGPRRRRTSTARADISHVNGGITAEAGQRYGDLDTVNGGISVARGASADAVETVNGGITPGRRGPGRQRRDGQRRHHAPASASASRTAPRRSTAAIRFGFNSRVGGDVETVNGGITVKQTEVGGQVRTVNGDITVGAKSRDRAAASWSRSRSGISFGWGKPHARAS